MAVANFVAKSLNREKTKYFGRLTSSSSSFEFVLEFSIQNSHRKTISMDRLCRGSIKILKRKFIYFHRERIVEIERPSRADLLSHNFISVICWIVSHLFPYFFHSFFTWKQIYHQDIDNGKAKCKDKKKDQRLSKKGRCRTKRGKSCQQFIPFDFPFYSLFSILYPHPHRSLLLIHFNSSGCCYIMLRRLCYIFLELSLYDACISIVAVVVDDYSSNKNETKTAILFS